MTFDLAELLGERLKTLNYTLATAESCTGGLVGHRITNVAGSSWYFRGGIIAYANEVKQNQLGVREETLKTYGAVSQATVIEMARGVAAVLDVDVAISVSGVAGPGGGTPEKPVGLVWFGLYTPKGTSAEMQQFSGGREDIKIQAAEYAIKFILESL